MRIPEEYQVLQREKIDDIQSQGWLLRHKKSGARVLLLENQDENKVFHITFRTPPADSTGVAHILEHSVLCGSREFPLKDPFVELVKGSLNTFLNAMTYPDKTMYPVASCNDQDFQNLMHVYLDAVFYPNIYKHQEIFRQEGWSYQLESLEAPLKYNGVVYNEMKGVFSSAEELLNRKVFDTLFPDNAYGVESGGDPECIPQLTYEKFLEFHKTYYHPSNSYIYLYGNMDMEEKLRWMDEQYLSHFSAQSVDSAICLQKPFGRMADLLLEYPVGEQESEEDNTYFSWSAVVGDGLDVERGLAFQVLEYALLDAPGAPLKQALLDAGLGKDIMGSYEDGIYQPFFSVVAKNAKTEDKERFCQVIHDTLEELAQKGIEKKALLAGINYFEFRFREADYSSYPKGLMYGIDVMDSWLYDDEAPFSYLKQLDHYESLKEKAQGDYFQMLIRECLLNNPHSALVAAVPKRGLAAEQEKKLEAKLAEKKASMSAQELEKLVQKTKALKEYQEREDSPEAVSCIPRLSRKDIRREALQLYNQERQEEGVPVLFHELYTNGISYVTLLFDTGRVPDDLIPYQGLLRAVLGYVDTEHYSYDQLFHEINGNSGGIYCGLHTYERDGDQKDCCRMFGIKAKCLYSQLDFVFRMIGEIIGTSKIRDEKRMREILARQRSRLEASLPGSGHVTAVYRSTSYFSPSAAFQDRTSGIDYYWMIADLEQNFDQRKEEIFSSLEQLMKLIFRPENLMVSYTSDQEGYEPLPGQIQLLKKRLYTERVDQGQFTFVPTRKNEGFKTAGQVQYVATSGNFRQAGYSYTGALRILKVIFNYEYLWTNIRVKGGAYGCMSGFKRNGDSYLVSYRDPNLKKTLEVFDGAADYLRTFQADEEEMTKYIIGTISEMDVPLTPSGKGSASLNAYMCQVSQEQLQQERDQVLSASAEDIRALADYIQTIVSQENICVVGSENAIDEETELFSQVKALIK